MPLSTALYDVVLTHTCPSCGNVNQRLGRYFWRMRHYHCTRCQGAVALSYEVKLKIFDNYRKVPRPIQPDA